MHRNAAITYAVLALLVRLVASQCSVFNLWFSRRCYERSRGEMITMLYEKTLSRKIIGTPMKPKQVVRPDGVSCVTPSMNPEGYKSQLKFIRERLFGAIGFPFSSRIDERPSEPKKPASMGKILNMMRHASLAVPFPVT